MPKTEESIKLSHEEMDLVTKGLDHIKGEAKKIRDAALKSDMMETAAKAQAFENKIEDLKTKFLYSKNN